MELKKILEDVKNNELDIDSALEILKDLPYEDLGYAHIDHHRSIRNGYPEVIYCKGKSDEHILGIIDRMNKKNTNILGTRCRKETFEKIIKIYPNAEYEVSARPDRQSKTCPRPPGRQWQCSSAYLFFLPYGCSHSRYPIYYTLSRIVCSSFRLDLGIVLHFHSDLHIFRHIAATFVLKPSLFSPLYAI